MNASNWIAICDIFRQGWDAHLQWVAGVSAKLPRRRYFSRFWPQRLMVFGALLLSLIWQPAVTHAQAPLTLKPDVPLTYSVKPGDTLWDISPPFLSDPWRWQELWAGNPQVDNPHLIYPGDKLTLVWWTEPPDWFPRNKLL